MTSAHPTPRRAADMASLPFTGQVFALAFVAYNTLFNLPDLDGQRRCFESVVGCLRDGARSCRSVRPR